MQFYTLACTGDKLRCAKTENPFPMHSNRITGGNKGVTVPWHSYMQREDRENEGSAIICGGTIINTKLVLTARHCFGGNDNAKELKRDEVNNAFVIAGLLGNLTLLEGNA